MAVVEVELLGGPADGAIRDVETGTDGCPPPLLTLRQNGAYIGASTEAEPGREHVYVREPSGYEVGPAWTYRYAQGTGALQ